MAEEIRTGAPDLTFDLVSVLYHSLQAAQTCGRFLRDAQAAGAQEAAAYFQGCLQQQRNLAERAKNLLVQRLGHPTTVHPLPAGPHLMPLRALTTQTNASVKSGGQPGDSQVDALSKQSFPASDAPATY